MKNAFDELIGRGIELRREYLSLHICLGTYLHTSPPQKKKEREKMGEMEQYIQ